MLISLTFFRQIKVRLRAFGFSVRAAAGIEFALIAPILVVMFLGTVEVSRYLSVVRRVQNASADIALAASALDQSPSGSDLWNIYHMAPFLIPEVVTDMRLTGNAVWWLQARVNISFLKMEKADPRCTTNCTLVAKVAWSYGRDRRGCGTVPFGDLANDVPSQFQRQPTNLVSVELKYTFAPLFTTFLRDRIVVERVFMAPPRHSDEIRATGLGDDGDLGTYCPDV